MSDLDDDLLALAGDGVSDSEFEPKDAKRESASPVSSGKRRKTHIEDDDDNNDDDDDNDGEQDGDVDDEEDDAGFDDEEDLDEGLVNPYPLEGKYRDEEDRANLLAMDEVQREQTLFDRSQEIESYNEKKYLQQRMKQQRTQAAGGKTTRTSTRAKIVKDSAKGSKLDKLSELRKQREQKSKRERRKQNEDYEDDEEEDDDEDDEAEDEGLDEDDFGYDEYDNQVAWGSGSSSVRPRTKRSTERANYESINSVKVGRTLLNRLCFYSDFSDAVIDCFARINVGMDRQTRQPIYRMVQIVDVKNIPGKAYKFPTTMVDIYLTVAQNRTQKKDFPMNVFSDSPISLEEFERYKTELSRVDEELPYLDYIKEKAAVLHQMANREVSDKDVNEMIRRKQNLNATGENLAAYDAVYQKSKIRDELRVAEQEQDIDKIYKLEKKLESIEAQLANSSKPVGTSSALTMAKVNERNRKLNQTNIRIAELKSSHMKKLAEASNDGGDPFSRFKTNTRMFYQDLVNEENEKALLDAKLNYEKELAEKSANEAKIASSSYRSLGVMDELIKGMELKIELEI
jgi:RNA polymerase-associated protein RTF1